MINIINVYKTQSGKVGVKVNFEYDPALVSYIKGFSTRSWDSISKVWNVYIPVTVGLEEAITKNEDLKYILDNRDLFNNKEKIEDILKKYKEVYDKVMGISKLIRVDDLKGFISDEYNVGDIPSPDGKNYYEYQKAGIYLIDYYLNYIKDNRGVIVGDDMGLGKTITAIGYMNYRLNDIKRVIVLCPASVVSVWVDKIGEWYLGEKNISVNKINGGNINIYSYNKFQKMYDNGEFVNLNYDLMIIDEFHYIKNYKSKRSKAVMELAKSITGKIIGLSGTPFENRPVELYNMLSIAQPSKWEFWAFVKRYCDAYKDDYGWNFNGASNLEELNVRLRKNVMIRREKKEVLNFLPDKSRDVLRFSVEKRGKEVEKVEKELFKYLDIINKKREELNGVEDKEDREKIKEELRSTNSVMFEMLATYRKQVGLEKIDIALDFLEDLLGQKDKVVVFAHHHEVIDKLVKYLDSVNIRYVVVTGEVSIEDRAKRINEFMNNKDVRVFIGGIRSASEGITLTVADVVVMLEFDLNPQKMLQAEDRVYRIGQKNNVNVYWLSIKDSFDDYLLNMVVNKIDLFEKGIVGKVVEDLNLVDI